MDTNDNTPTAGTLAGIPEGYTDFLADIKSRIQSV